MMSSFDRDDWWDQRGFLFGLHTLLDPVRIPYFSSVLARRVPPQGRVLDLGCGGGYVTNAMADAGYQTIGIDPSSDSVRAASAFGDGHFVVGRGEELPFPTSSFDAVICSEVLEHVNSPSLVLGEIARTSFPVARCFSPFPTEPGSVVSC